jgi:acetyl/propionyl-CoA carboxylase alpha subunit
VLIKATAGGGGKGMKIVDAAAIRRGARVGAARGRRRRSATIACSSRNT